MYLAQSRVLGKKGPGTNIVATILIIIGRLWSCASDYTRTSYLSWTPPHRFPLPTSSSFDPQLSQEDYEGACLALHSNQASQTLLVLLQHLHNTKNQTFCKCETFIQKIMLVASSFSLHIFILV